MIWVGECPGHLKDVWSTRTPRSKTFPVFTSRSARSTEAGDVTAFRAPTSSLGPQIQPHPFPCVQPRASAHTAPIDRRTPTPNAIAFLMCPSVRSCRDLDPVYLAPEGSWAIV